MFFITWSVLILGGCHSKLLQEDVIASWSPFSFVF